MKPYVNRFDRWLPWKLFQWGGLAIAVLNGVVAFGGWYFYDFSIWAVLSIVYLIFCLLVVSFMGWYVRWYYSDAGVRQLARRARLFGPEWVEEKLGDHPRKEEILEEMERPTKK